MHLTKALAPLLFLFFAFTTAYPQRSVNIHDHLLIRDSNRYLYGPALSEYEGSPYLNDSFDTAYVYMGSIKFRAVPMRYNIFADVMEYEDGGQRYYLAPDPRITRIVFSGQVFVVRKFKHLSKVEYGFLELLEDGKAALMAKKLVNFRERNELQDIPAKFSRLPDNYYYRVDDQAVEKAGSLKSIIEHFPDKQSHLTQFAKSKKISAKEGDDLVKLFEYYNSLTGAN